MLSKHKMSIIVNTLYCRWRFNFQEEMIGIPFAGLTPQHVCSCPKPESGFPALYVVDGLSFFLFNQSRGLLRFVHKRTIMLSKHKMSIIVNTHFAFRQHNRVFMHSVIFTEPVITRKNNYVIMFVKSCVYARSAKWVLTIIVILCFDNIIVRLCTKRKMSINYHSHFVFRQHNRVFMHSVIFIICM
jgi:hypothetical protein